MFNKKFLSGAILTAAVCLTACSRSGNEVSGTVSETISEAVTAAAETTSAASETTADVAETEDLSIIDSIKEALKDKWSNVDYIQMYAEDLNGDGIKELFVNYSPESGKCGVTYIFDVSDGVKMLYQISLRTAKGHLYTDENGGLHYIIRTGYNDGMDRYAYYDVAYDGIEIPFYADTKNYDNSMVYKNCKFMPGGIRTGFSSSNAEFVGNFERNDIYMAWFKEESNEISELVSEVFDGLTYASEATSVYLGRGFESFEEFIKDAEPKLELVYGDAKPADTSDADYIKEALKAEWDDDVRVADLYTVDLNGDGVKELFVNYSFGSAMNGLVYVYDVSDGVKKLYEIPARIWANNASLYKDNDEKIHVIMENGYGSTSLSEQDYAVFNIAYDELKQPLFANVYDWYNGGAHIHEYDLYKNCEIVPDAKVFDGRRNFDPEKAEYIGRYDLHDVWHAFDKQEENEIREIIQKEVYEGLTYISDIEELYSDSGYTADYDTPWDFEYFWQQAAPKLAEAYGGAASAKSVDTSGVEYMKEVLKADWDNSATARDVTGSSGMTAANLYAADMNGDGVKELFVNYSFGAGADGFLCVYDVSDGVKKLYEISARIWADKAELYTDTDGNVHFILANGFSTWVSTYDYAFFDITYDNIKMPFYADNHQYHNDVGHVCEYNIYKNCEVVPNVETFKGWRNFDSEKAEYIGKFDTDCVLGVPDNGESSEISEINELIQKEVYEGMTYVADIEMICESSGNVIDYNFEDFWQEAAPKLAEEYNK